jgi:predicted amidohydrolase YtcJ
VLDANQDMPREAILYACTTNATRAVRQAATGATFALLDRDVLTVPAAQMRDIRVLCTIVAREWAYSANGLAATHCFRTARARALIRRHRATAAP